MPNHRVYKKCAGCGGDYYGGNDRFCSNACYLKFHEAKILICQKCGKEFTGRRHSQKCCSKKCGYDLQKNNNQDERHGYKYKRWVQSVYQRDEYKCQQCGKEGAIHAHHIKAWKDFPELRYDVSNGVTLCKDCHSVIHGRRITRAALRFKPVCERCGKMTKGHSRFCRSCSMKKDTIQSVLP